MSQAATTDAAQVACAHIVEGAIHSGEIEGGYAIVTTGPDYTLEAYPRVAILGHGKSPIGAI